MALVPSVSITRFDPIKVFLEVNVFPVTSMTFDPNVSIVTFDPTKAFLEVNVFPVTSTTLDPNVSIVTFDPINAFLDVNVLPVTTNIFEPLSSTNKFEPTSNVCTGKAFAIPTLLAVIKDVPLLLNSTVLEAAVLPCKMILSRVKFDKK